MADLERLKKARRLARTAFTRKLTTLNAIIAGEQPNLEEIQVEFKLLEVRAFELEKLDRSMWEKLLETDAEDDVFIEEGDGATEYTSKFLRAKIDVARIIDRENPELPAAANTRNNRPNQDTKKRYKLPKLELKKFSGELKDWLQFWSQFKKIHEDTEITEEDKFQYLVQAMIPDTRAAELVNSFPPTAENYAKVIESMKKRFGKDELLVEVYVRELLRLVLNNAGKPNQKITLSSIYDKLESHLRALETLGVTEDKCAAMLYPLVESSLPEDLLRAWQRYASSLKAEELKNRLTTLMKFLQDEVENEERITMAIEGFTLNDEATINKDKVKKKNKPEVKNDIPTAAGLFVAKENKKTRLCIFCDGEHDSIRCEKAKKMTLDERQSKVKEKNCCFGCLLPGHNVNRCRLRPKCPWCSRRHALVLCRGMTIKEDPEKESSVADKDLSLANISIHRDVFLQTIRVKLKNNEGKERTARAIFDTGSQRSYISKEAVQDMKYEIAGEQQLVHLLFGGQKTKPQEHRGYRIHLKSLDNKYACNFIALDQEIICHAVSTVNNGPWTRELKNRNIELTDRGESNEPITILIGADIFGKLLTGKVVNLDCGMTAIETHLGWTLMGKKPQQDNRHEHTALVVTSMFMQDADISDLWRLDVLGITDPSEKKSEEARQEEIHHRFLQSVVVNEEQRYEVRLPWKECHPTLPTNRELTEKRLFTTTKRLRRQNLYYEYDKVFKEWQQEGIVEKVDESEIDDWGHYLPHRPVVKENSTTKIRPVFDASAAEKGEVSLNQCLESGPNFIELISTMLLRFREKRIGVISDIKKAFLQISISPKDRNALRFLWWKEDGSRDIVIYRHTRVVFGVTSSPFLLAAVISLHLENNISKENLECTSDSIEKLKKSFYVDNCVTSVDDEYELQKFKDVATAIMKEGAFDLRGWEHSGCAEPTQSTSVLGMTWNKVNDTLMLKKSSFEDIAPEKITKRIILAASHKVFDPIGVACPVLLLPKVILQTLTKLEWDTEVEPEVKEQFVGWYDSLKLLSELEIPRWMLSDKKEESNLSFHVFVDASRAAHAVVIYTRVQTLQDVKVHMVEAKSRVAPSKEISIPRLELLAATLGARLMNSICTALEYENPKIYFWSDSSTVLAWIHHHKQWATFVWNRVKEIRELSNPEDWRHVPGQMNPADLPSRGCTVKQLLESKWWQGPSWLKNDVSEWPKNEYSVDENEMNSELKKSAVKSLKRQKSENTTMTTTCETISNKEYGWYMKYFSKYSKVIRMMAWMRRFIFNATRKNDGQRKGELSAKEFDQAEKFVIRLAQKESFLTINDQRLKGLNIFFDGEGLIRLNTLVSRREDNRNFVAPIILDPNHELTTRLIHHHHENLSHAGVQIVLNSLRENFWVLSARKAVRAVINKCVRCKRFKASHVEVPSAVLPVDRVRDADVFEIIGIDFAGPLYLRGGQKTWICLFTCAVYRAIHLELVTSLSTEAFLEALRRFIARRGRPALIYSDNGTNFTGAKRLFHDVDWNAVQKYSSVNKMEWRLNPPCAPWWGGWWERMVRSVKELLRKVLGKACLSYEELNTVLCDCESIVNSRPITYLSDDSNEPRPLTPAMFLSESREIGVPDLDQIDSIGMNKRIKYRRKLREDLRRRFRIEYLGQLKRRQGKDHRYEDLNVGDVVLIGYDNFKRLDWPLGKIIELIAGKDEKVRVVRLKTATGELVRPVQRIFPLEIGSNIQIHAIYEPKIRQRNSSLTKKKRIVSTDQDDKITKPVKEANEQDIRTRSGRRVKIPEKLKE